MPGRKAISNTCYGEKEKCEAGVYHAKNILSQVALCYECYRVSRLGPI